jgi:TPR repeat protein
MLSWVVRAALVLALGMPTARADLVDCAPPDLHILIKTNPTRALAACRRLADQGDATAQNNLGVLYHKGQGVPQNYTEAVKWYRMSADQGYALAQYNLGIMYYQGQGVPQNYTEAVKWYRMSADQGHAQAQYSLGVMYEQGQGVPQDYVQAHMWFNLAASQGAELAFKNRDKVAALMTPSQIEKAQALAAAWKPKPHH